MELLMLFYAPSKLFYSSSSCGLLNIRGVITAAARRILFQHYLKLLKKKKKKSNLMHVCLDRATIRYKTKPAKDKLKKN